MPSPNAIFNELVTTTFRNHKKTMLDQVSRNNALLTWLNNSDNKVTVDGGLSLVQPLEYAQNNTYQRYSGYDVLNTAQSDVFTAAEFPWRQISINVVASGQELRINSGKNQIIDLVRARVKNAMHTWNNNFSFDIYSDGTATNQIGGLQSLVSDSGIGVVGGIDASQYPFWQNVVQSAAAPLQGGAPVTLSPTTIEAQMLALWLNQVRGNDKPDLIVADNNFFAMYDQSQLSMKRYTGQDANGDFETLKYKGAKIVFDGNSGIPANRMYFLNTQYIQLQVHKDADMSELGERTPYNQDAEVIPVIWMGNLTIGNRRLQAILKP